MPNIQQIWERFDFLALLDIVLVAALIYWLLGIIRGTRAVQLLRGVGILVVIALVAGSVLPLTTLRWIIRSALSPALFVAIPILFQPELRRALETLGRTGDWFSRIGTSNRSELEEMITTIARAAKQLSQQGIGALMVIERNTGLQEYADRGVIVDSRISVPLLVNIFFPNAPLHDMAVIFRRNRILAANCVLPLSENVVGNTRYGTRHRAALGISEQSDAIAIVVSEETGSISITHDGRMVRHLNEGRLRRLLAGLLKIQVKELEEA
ncbi:MAG: diadenylate cyclase CdaA [Herpetosiphon sp.]|nr:diadenylate cyclase CdaA [Herpetosiphon sp.]